jgi:hypothetical protein
MEENRTSQKARRKDFESFCHKEKINEIDMFKPI